MTRDQATAYIAAFVDGEGHIGCAMTSRGRTTKTLSFSNTDQELYDRVIELTLGVGLVFRTHFYPSKREGWSDKWVAYLRGGKPAFEHFQAIIPLQSPRKQRALAQIIASYKDMEPIYASKRTSFLVVCLACAKKFSVFPADIARGQGKYCSRQCYSADKMKNHSTSCKFCGIFYYVPPSQRKKTNFCSQSCVGKSQAERLRALASFASNARWGKVRAKIAC